MSRVLCRLKTQLFQAFFAAFKKLLHSPTAPPNGGPPTCALICYYNACVKMAADTVCWHLWWADAVFTNYRLELWQAALKVKQWWLWWGRHTQVWTLTNKQTQSETSLSRDASSSSSSLLSLLACWSFWLCALLHTWHCDPVYFWSHWA